MPVSRIHILDEPCEGLDINALENILHRLDSLASSPRVPPSYWSPTGYQPHP